MNKETELKPAKWRRLRTVPGVIGMTILTTLVGAGITWLVGDLKEANFRPSDAIKLSVETDPAKMSETNSNARYWSAVIPSTVRTHGSPFKDGGCRGFHSWVADNHGTDAGTSILQISAQGATDKAVLIQNMRVSDSNAPFGFTLAKGETESFVVSASAAKATYRWRIEFVWSSTGWRIPWKSAERMDSQQPWPRTRLGNGIT